MALAVVDANLLIYAFDKTDEAHVMARQWLSDVLASDDVLAVPMFAITALLRVSTHHSLDHLPERLEDALGFVDDLIAIPNVRVLHTDGAHWAELNAFSKKVGSPGGPSQMRSSRRSPFNTTGFSTPRTVISADSLVSVG